MPLAPDQWRLLWAALLCGLPLFAGYRLARKLQPPFEAASDAILIAYLIQYVTVGIAGLAGFLSAIGLTCISLPLCAALWIFAGSIKPAAAITAPSRSDRYWMSGICLAAIGFIGAIIFQERFDPPLVTDALTYHLPAAVFWLQNHRITLFQAWFFNPANTFSPLAGSMFAAWLMAPMGNDSLARFMQLGPSILVLLTLINLARNAGAKMPVAALVAFAAVVSRPFLGEAIVVKDDLFVTAFFLTAVSALSINRYSGKFSAFRVGISVGLMLAMKFTAVLTLPMLLLAVDAPIRAGWRWRQWLAAAGCIALIAGPWYLRNLFLCANPVFPMKVHLLGMTLPGLIPSIHVQALRSFNGVWQILTGGYLGMPPSLFVFLSLIWLVASLRLRKSLAGDSLRRIILLGPPLGIAVYVIFSPQAEVRFLFPAFALMFAASALAFTSIWGVAVAGIIATLAACTSFVPAQADQIRLFLFAAIVLTIAGLFVRWLEKDVLRLRRPLISCACIALFLLFVFARWPRYVQEYREGRFQYWQSVYPTHTDVWSFVDSHIPATATIAYSNQFMIYPLYGFEYARHVVYAPVRFGASISNLKFPDQMQDSEFFNDSMHAANTPADLAAWLKNLRASGAEYLVVGSGIRTPETGPELGWANADPTHFTKIFANEQAAVYRIGISH